MRKCRVLLRKPAVTTHVQALWSALMCDLLTIKQVSIADPGQLQLIRSQHLRPFSHPSSWDAVTNVKFSFKQQALSLLLSLPFLSLPEWVKYSTHYPSFHILFKESPPPPPHSSDDFKSFCLCQFLFSVLLYFCPVYSFLDLVLSLFKLLSLTFSTAFVLLKFPFVKCRYRKWFGSSHITSGF